MSCTRGHYAFERHRAAAKAVSAFGRRSPMLGYGVALLSSLLALGVALVVAPVVNDAPVPLFLAAVTISAWAGGLGPGLLASVVAGLALAQLFDLARGSLLLAWQDTALDVALFLGVAVLISGLNARLRMLNKRMDAARAEAEAAVATRDRVLAVVAHDLTSPLTGIIMTGQMAGRLLERTDRDERPRVLDQLRQVEGEARRMVSVIDELLDVARLQAGGALELRRAPVRLLDVVEAAVRRHQPAAGRHTLRLVQHADPTGVWDAARLGRVLDNLLSNAMKYSPAGGDVTVELSVEDDEAGTSWAVVRVRDLGIGIPPHDLPHVFGGFFRARNVGQIPGTGIGLAAARQIIRQHGGELTVDSQEGHGSTFTLRLPRQASTLEADPTSTRPSMTRVDG